MLPRIVLHYSKKESRLRVSPTKGGQHDKAKRTLVMLSPDQEELTCCKLPTFALRVRTWKDGRKERSLRKRNKEAQERETHERSSSGLLVLEDRLADLTDDLAVDEPSHKTDGLGTLTAGVRKVVLELPSTEMVGR